MGELSSAGASPNDYHDKLTQSAQITRRVNPAGQVFVPAETARDGSGRPARARQRHGLRSSA
ncbi:hypothetical protein B2M20_10085 [Nitrobacter vulgaris]|uniref:Uncharacterized protein n=1 Tax=Nitrobacter vulgaris TaxID=29421 RepID=A0A1V4HZ68_NITVU|nr:hypothetical protein B2M20_10085 [Nitrobacter vulgaris]